MTTRRNDPLTLPADLNPMATIGALLAQGVIRLKERQDRLDRLTEERVSRGVSTTQENPHE